MELTLYRKQGSKFRTLFKPLKGDFCELMKIGVGANSNYVLKSLMEMIKQFCPGAIRECPYSGKISCRNISLNKDWFRIVPSGVFRSEFKAFDPLTKSVGFLFTVDANVTK